MYDLTGERKAALALYIFFIKWIRARYLNYDSKKQATRFSLLRVTGWMIKS